MFGEVVVLYVVVCQWVTFVLVRQMVVFLNARSFSIGGVSEGVLPIAVGAFWGWGRLGTKCPPVHCSAREGEFLRARCSLLRDCIKDGSWCGGLV